MVLTNLSRRSYRLEDSEINLTTTQQYVFIFVNFAMALILLIVVNCDHNIQCGLGMKHWLLVCSIILALGSLICVMGLDIERQARGVRRIHESAKLAQYFILVGW